MKIKKKMFQIVTFISLLFGTIKNIFMQIVKINALTLHILTVQWIFRR